MTTIAMPMEESMPVQREAGRSPSRAAPGAGSAPRILVLCPQGGTPEAEFNAAIAGALAKAGSANADVSVVCLRQVDAETIRGLAPAVHVLQSFEASRDERPPRDVGAEALRLSRDYPDVNWWEIAAAERSLIDSSFLVGGLGQRTESRDHIEGLVVDLVRHLEAIFAAGGFTAVVCPVADSLIIHVFYQVARRFGAEVLALSPNAWIREDRKPGFYIARDEFMHNGRMEAVYRELSLRAMTDEERKRSQRFQKAVVEFEIERMFQAVLKRPFVVPAVSPNLKRLWAYLRENAARRKDVEYYKIDVVAKAKANLLRAWRRWRTRGIVGSPALDIPARSVFYPMQYQPEQTTLVGGIYFANQVAVIENIAKALPFGCTLIVKEHPRGRGARPAWQYSHIAHFPNVRFCDGNAKEILRRCDAVVTVTSTVGLEGMALDRAVILLGQCYYDFADVIYRPKSWPDLAATLRRILIDREYERSAARRDLIDRFFLAYLAARVPVALGKDSAEAIAAAALAEIDARAGQAAVAAHA
jgi:hypothetical protein